MTHHNENLLSESELSTLQSIFHQGSSEASHALERWIGKPSIVEIDSLELLPIEDAANVLTSSETPICFCTVIMDGLLTGELILAFDDSCGLALADMLLDLPEGSTNEWSEMAISAALETTNILCCAYLNSLSRSFSRSGESAALIPSPPKFSRDFAQSLIEFALMGQAIASDQVMLTRTTFSIDATPVNWILVFVPDAESMVHLPHLLSENV